MSRNGSGTYSLPAGNPVTTGTTISSTTHNNTLADIASALTDSLAKDGQTTPTANLPMGGYAHTGVGDATARTQYAKVSQVQDGRYVTLSSVLGTDTITATCAPTIAAYAAGQFFTFVSAGANTGAVTLNIDNMGAKAVTKEGTTALAAGDIAAGAVVCVEYDGTRFQVVGGRSVQPLDAQLTTLAGITAQQAADLASVSTFMGTVLNDADAATARATLELPALLNQNYGSDGTTKVIIRSTAGVDFNTMISSGVYNFDAGSSANTPVLGWVFLEVYRHDNLTAGSEYTVQIAHDMKAGTLPRSWTRRQVGGTWSAWQLTTPVAPGAAPVYACRAWVNFDGTGTVAIRASGNVSSITDNGVGDFTINFTTALPDANYSVASSAGNADSSSSSAPLGIAVPVNASSCRLGSWQSQAVGTRVDFAVYQLAVFR